MYTIPDTPERAVLLSRVYDEALALETLQSNAILNLGTISVRRTLLNGCLAVSHEDTDEDYGFRSSITTSLVFGTEGQLETAKVTVAEPGTFNVRVVEGEEIDSLLNFFVNFFDRSTKEN